MRKRMTSLLLTLVMLLSLVPAMGVTASAADGFVEVSTYEQLKNAVDKGAAKVKLMTNIDTTNENGGAGLTSTTNLTFKGGGHVLNLNGHTLKLVTSVKDAHLIVVESQDVTIKDSSTSGSGRIEMEFGENLANVQYPIYISSMGSLTIDGGTFSSSSNRVNYIECYGSLTINGGTIVSNSKRQVNLIKCEDANLTINGGKLQIPDKNEHGMSYGYAVYTENHFGDDRQIVITGGEIDGKVAFTRNDSSATGTPKYNKLPVKITGGVFKQKVYAYYSQKPSGEITEFSPAVELAGGTFKDVYNENLASSNGLATKLTAGTFEKSANIVTHVSDTTMAGYRACLGNSVILRGNECRTACDWSSMQGFEVSPTGMYFIFREAVVIPDAWGVMESVTLDGTTTINYAKDWKGAAVEIDNSKDRTITFKWKDLADELVKAGYSYDAKCEHYVSGSTAVQETENIAANATSHTITIEKGADPKVYSFDLKLNLEKNGNLVGIVHNQHIVKLVVKPAEVPKPDPTIDGTVYYTSGIVYGSPISISTSVTPAEATKSYQWQRSTDGGSTWENIDGADSNRYTPVAADMGKNVRIRVKVTANGYLGEIVGAPLTVSKATNNGYPAVIQLEAVQDEAGAYTGFKINNYDSDCEYVYSKDSTPDWSENQITSATAQITSTTATVTGLESNKTYYVFARFEETKTHTAGSIVSKNSIGLFDKVLLDGVVLEGYDGPGTSTIYIKEGESVELKVSADPSNANSWSEITFKDSSVSSLGTSNITISNEKINASGEDAASFPKHSITITGVSKGSATLEASYPGINNYYGTWYVVVYDDSTVDKALRLENVYTYADITLSVNDEAKLPTDLPKLLPEGSGYHLEWRILKKGTTGATYVTENDNIKLEDGKIKPRETYNGSEKTQLDLVAVKDGSTEYKTLPKKSLFYVTVTEAPTIDLIDLTVAPAMVNLEIGKDIQLSAVKQPANAEGTPEWKSSNTDVATVDGNGKVTAVAKGEATITVSCGDKEATCTVLVDHKHSYSDQPYLYLDPGNHYQECKAGDSYNIQAHEFTPWADNGNGTHSRHCTVCKMANGSTYTETAEHNWVWVVDQEAALNQPGLQHEECTVCPAKRNENTEIPALRDYAVTVTGGTATAAAGTITRAMEGVEVTVTAQAPIGKHFVKWVVKAGGVTLANETSATTTFTMPANDVTIEANFEKNASTGTGTGATTYPITVKSAKNGDVTASHKSAAKGTTVTLTVDPDKGYLLDTLTVLDGKDKECKLTDKGDGKFTFTMPDSKVTVEATFKPLTTTGKHPFTDVPAGAYYEDAVVWAVGKNITTGMSATTFDPNGSCTRAQIVTFLWRAAGSPEPKTMKGFDDVASNAYYAKAVAWAVENGITTGTSASKFSPNDPCTRTQAVTFLFRYAAANGMEAVTMQELLSGYADAASVPSYAVSAMNWALAAGILQGDGVKLMPNATCTRAQIVTFLYRAMK